MAEILCAGVTHHPGFMGPDAEIASLLRRTLKSPRVPARLKDIRNWPEGMQTEWGNDEGVQAAKMHRRQIWDAFGAVRDRIRAFKPDFIVIWGDDQYEQFREDCVPPFNVFIFDKVNARPFLIDSPINPRERNFWGEAVDKTFTLRGHPAGAGYLTQRLLENGFDVAYSYKLRDEHSLPHSFLNTMVYFDFDRTGFDYPIVPFHVNCYGSSVIRSRGAMGHLFAETEKRFDPISPTPKRCFEIGAETARILHESPWRVALIASSSWSHAFLTEKNGWIYPDMEADRRCFEDLRASRYSRLRDMSLKDIEASGQQEVLNWCCLAGALDELDLQKADYIDFVESYIFNSNKVMLAYEPV